jgi:hypothetical protein
MAILHEIKGEVRGGGVGVGAWVARITGPHPKFGLDRSFVKRRENLSGSRKSGSLSWSIVEPGYYELRGVQYGASEASIGDLDNGFIHVSDGGDVERVEKAQVIAAFS